MRIFLITIFTVVALISLSCVSVNACWCKKAVDNTEKELKEAVSRQLSSSDFVFSGTLVQEDDEHLTFKIENSWKGNIKDKITFLKHHFVNKNGEKEFYIEGCDYRFMVGDSYLVYASVAFEGLEAGYCWRTDLLTNAQRDVEELNRQKQISKLFDFSPATLFLFRQ